MSKTVCRLTVLFGAPFWVGVYERISDGMLEVCKITFGAEPKDYEVYAFLLQNWDKLQFSSPIKADAVPDTKINPKRMQREIKRQLNGTGIGTKAQQAMKHSQAEGKEARKKKSRLEREREKERLLAIKQEKRRQKHKGH